MAATDPQSLLRSANCYQCLTPGEQQLIRLVLLANILNGTMVATDPQSLLSQANCFQCTSPGERDLLELVLLAQIMNGGGSTTANGGVLIDGTGGPPPVPTKPWISYPTGGGGISTWDVASQTWI